MRPLLAATLLLATLDASAQCPVRFDGVRTYVHGMLHQLGDFDGDGHLDTLTVDNDPRAMRVNRGRADGTFTIGEPIGVGETTATALGDWNDDGDLDVVRVALGGGAHFYPGRGDGTFDAARDLGFLGGVYDALEAADFDGDGHLDLAAGLLNEQQVHILWGAGDGTFPTRTVVEGIAEPARIAIGDLNGDLRPDLVVAPGSSNSLAVIVGGDARTFTVAAPIPLTAVSYGLALRDVNGDGHLDLATADAFAFVLSVAPGNGDGTFGARRDYPAGQFTEGVAFGDFDGDAYLDAVLGNSINSEVIILRGQPDGSFGAPISHPAGQNLFEVSTADLNGDGRTDIVAYDTIGYGVLLQQDDHSFGQFESLPAAFATDLTAIDINGDTLLDLVMTEGDLDSLLVYLGNSDGTFEPARATSVGARFPYRLATADLNHDDKNDVVTANFFDNSITVLLGRGDGTFDAPVVYPAGAGTVDITLGDIDSDGDADAAVALLEGASVLIFINDGHGTLTRGIDVAARHPQHVNLADLNGDGRPELLVGDRTDSIESEQPGFFAVHPGNGDGTFGTVREYSNHRVPTGSALADFNRDGKIDVAVPDFSRNTRIYLGDGTGALTLHATLPHSLGVQHLAAADFTGDGIPDLAEANGYVVMVYAGNGDGTFDLPDGFVAGSGAYAVAAIDTNHDGRPDPAIGTTLTRELVLMHNETTCRRRAARH
jgi:hypothetical protein